MTNSHIIQYQSLLLDHPQLTFAPTRSLNPALLMSDDDPHKPLHDCEDMLDQVNSGGPDLTHVPLTEAEAILFMDGSSQVIGLKRQEPWS